MQLDLFYDTTEHAWDKLTDRIGENQKKILVTMGLIKEVNNTIKYELQCRRAEELNLSLEEYKTWLT